METIYKEILCLEDEFRILHALLNAGGDFVSGTVLAQELGISRPAVWAKLEKLRAHGFEFDAIRRRGYRLTKEPEVLHPGLVRHYLEAAGAPIDFHYFPVIDSTNSEAERQLSHGRKGPFVIASSCQTRGRGRLGRDWYSASAQNLYLSVLFEPNIRPQQLQHFTLWAGIHICRALQSYIPEAVLSIKWPNDLECSGRKFAGMLTEAKMDADSMRSVIFGLGLNLNSNPAHYPPEIRSRATSLHAVGGRELPINPVAARITEAVQAAYAACINGKTGERLSVAWAPLNALKGRNVTAWRGTQAIRGTAEGIDDSGALLLRDADGSLQSVRAGDVTLTK